MKNEPTNIFCYQCKIFQGQTQKQSNQFYQEHGFTGCLGIVKIPYSGSSYRRPLCFIQELIKTEKQIKQIRIDIIQKIIEHYKDPKKAAEYIVNVAWDSI